MRIFPFLLLLLCVVECFSLSAQTVQGKVVDKNGEPIPNASLYIREVTQGIMADDQGAFETSLREGTYTFEFSSLGYERKAMTITVDRPEIIVEAVLEHKVYSLKEVTVSSKREDPAYAIMRKAIGMAPFYLHQINRYESEVYLKGTLRVDKIPKILSVQMNDKSLKKEDIINQTYLLESQNKVSFTAPDQYDQQVLAFSSSVPGNIDAVNAMDIITTNIYDPNAFDRISPLSSDAFTYYKFTWEGAAAEGEHVINKIRVQPKKKNPKLVTGWLYIIENSWNVKSADLSATEFGITIRFTATYNEVLPYAFLPTAYDMDMSIDIMGVKAVGKYYSSIQYNEVQLNEAQGVIRKKEQPVAAKPKEQTPKQQKAQQKLEELAQKDNLSNRDAARMSKLMHDLNEPEEQRKKEQPLRLNDERPVKVSVDSLARQRDSLYWKEVRDLPLRPEEIASYQRRDSLKLNSGPTVTSGSVVASAPGPVGGIIGGGGIPIGKRLHIHYNGLLGIVPEYNFVDGFWLGQRISVTADLGKNKHLRLSPSVYYMTARKDIAWQVDAAFEYAGMRGGELAVSVGNTSADYNKEGDLRLINSLSSLFFAENTMKFYQKRFVEATNKIDITNGLRLTVGYAYEERDPLENIQSYSFFGGKPKNNMPKRQFVPALQNKAMLASVGLEFTPRYYYWEHRNKKHYSHSRFPTLSVSYQKGIDFGDESNSVFDKIEAGIRQEIKLTAFDRLSYHVNAGKFFNVDWMWFPDYKHFRTSELFITGNALENSFSLIDNYTYSTNDKWLQAHLNYTSSYLLIKRIPFLQSYLFDEALHARTLWIPYDNYTEAGYSIGLDAVGRVGVFVGFKEGKYDAVGVTIGIPILRSMGVR